MRHLFARESSGVLAQLAWAKVLVAFDFDGTLAPIVADRDMAEMRERTRELFERVCGLYPSAVISGRGKEDVAARLGTAPVAYVVGNHGLEPGAGLDDFAEEIGRARIALEQALKFVPGVDLEDKRYSLAVHYRRSRNKGLVRADILAAIAALPIPTRVVAGKLVVNVLPERAPNKGDALLALRSAANADVALYVGDDVTDEDVFELDQPGRLVSVRVGESRSSAAAYFLRDQREIDRLLERLVALRQKPTPR